MNSYVNAASDFTTVCASCGIAGIDDVKLKQCNGCYLVRYCGIECQREHWRQHKRECKKRAAKLRDELLFRQPESTHVGDCPLCCLPLPLDRSKSSMCSSCSIVTCNGCEYANSIREFEMRLERSCPFCRATPSTLEECGKLRMKRVKVNDPLALRVEGVKWHKKGVHIRAFEYLSKAAEFGDLEAHCKLAFLYQLGRGVEQDKGKCIYHLEKAAIGGHPFARYNLGWHENKNGNFDRAVKHWIIAAAQGEDDSIKALMNAFKNGFVEKEGLAAALRAHQAAVDETKSPQREVAEKFYLGYEM